MDNFFTWSVPTSLPRKRKQTISTGKKRKRYPKKPKPPSNPELLMDDIPSNDEIDIDWVDTGNITEEENEFSANESDIDPADDTELLTNEKE